MNTIKLILIITVNILFAIDLSSQTVEWEWAKSGGGGSDDIGYCIQTDLDSNIIVAGMFNSTAYFDELQITALTYWGGGFIVKYDNIGNILWIRKLTGTRTSNIQSLTTDNTNIYVTGSFTETTYADSISLISNGSADIFIGRYDENGNLLWFKSAGSIGLDAGMSIICSDSLLFIGGQFEDSIFFDSTLLISKGSSDIFLACLDFYGNYQWIKQAGGIYSDVARSTTLDNNSNIIIAGYINTSANFGETDTIVITNGSADPFVASYSSEGNFLWVNSFGGIEGDRGISVISDSGNNLFLHGHFYGTAYFDGITLTSTGDEDYFICKLSPNGSVIWAKKIGATVYPLDDAWKKTLVGDEQGNVYITGWFMDSLVFDDLTVQSNGVYDIFVMKIDTDGNLAWCLTAGNSTGDYSRSIARDGNGNLFITGRFYNTLFFGDSSVTSYGSADVFIAKIREEPVSVVHNEENSLLEITVYPNPTRNYLNIGNSAIGFEKAEIIGMNGTILRSYGQNSYLLNVSGLTKGTYLLKLYYERIIFVKKIIIQ